MLTEKGRKENQSGDVTVRSPPTGGRERVGGATDGWARGFLLRVEDMWGAKLQWWLHRLGRVLNVTESSALQWLVSCHVHLAWIHPHTQKQGGNARGGAGHLRVLRGLCPAPRS